MTIIKTVEFRNNLKEILEKIYNGEEDIVLDYYGKLFNITAKTNSKKTKKKTHAQEIIEKYRNLPPMKLTDPIFNEKDPAQEKANFRNLMASRYDNK